MSLSKKKRFEIFERDNFTCQYCGATPPDVVLHVDHIHPRSKGGLDDEINLITSCLDCNLGKRDKIIKNQKTKEQLHKLLEETKEKEDQLNQYYKYTKKIERRKNKIIEDIDCYWRELWKGTFALSPAGKRTIKYFLTFLSFLEIKESMEIAICKINDDPRQCFKYFCGIVYNKKRQKLE